MWKIGDSGDISLVLLFFVLGLMAKPMLVTLPFVLLLLDYWPLQRFQEIKPDHKVQPEVLKSVTSDKQKRNLKRSKLQRKGNIGSKETSRSRI